MGKVWQNFDNFLCFANPRRRWLPRWRGNLKRSHVYATPPMEERRKKDFLAKLGQLKLWICDSLLDFKSISYNLQAISVVLPWQKQSYSIWCKRKGNPTRWVVVILSESVMADLIMPFLWIIDQADASELSILYQKLKSMIPSNSMVLLILII